MDGNLWLNEIRDLYRQYKSKCERAAAQVSDQDLFKQFGECPHSIAILMKHVGNNHSSRWRDFLTTDGEKRDRNREKEFITSEDDRDSITQVWEQGWLTAFTSLSDLTEEHLDKTITIRGEPMNVITAIHRNLNHIVYHTGQIVMLARHFTGENWQTLSIAVGKSDAHNAAMQEKYGNWWAKEQAGD